MVTNRSIDAPGRCGGRLVAAVALFVFVAVLPCAAAATDGSASTAAAPAGESASLGDAEAHAAPAAATPVSTTRSQLLGVILVLLVLAGIGVAVWGVGPGDLRRLERAPSVLGWAPSGRFGEADDVPRDAAVERELLTDEERIIELLEENDGRLRQQHVVETTDWSKAKVSRLLSSMEDEDAIVRIQLGREKLIFLSGHEPSGARPAHHEEG